MEIESKQNIFIRAKNDTKTSLPYDTYEKFATQCLNELPKDLSVRSNIRFKQLGFGSCLPIVDRYRWDYTIIWRLLKSKIENCNYSCIITLHNEESIEGNIQICAKSISMIFEFEIILKLSNDLLLFNLKLNNKLNNLKIFIDYIVLKYNLDLDIEEKDETTIFTFLIKIEKDKFDSYIYTILYVDKINIIFNIMNDLFCKIVNNQSKEISK